MKRQIWTAANFELVSSSIQSISSNRFQLNQNRLSIHIYLIGKISKYAQLARRLGPDRIPFQKQNISNVCGALCTHSATRHKLNLVRIRILLIFCVCYGCSKTAIIYKSEHRFSVARKRETTNVCVCARCMNKCRIRNSFAERESKKNQITTKYVHREIECKEKPNFRLRCREIHYIGCVWHILKLNTPYLWCTLWMLGMCLCRCKYVPYVWCAAMWTC